MGIYNGFNALGIGQAVGNTWNQKRQNGKELLELLNKFGHSAVDAYDENQKREALLASAGKLGVTEELASGMDNAQLAQFLQGVKTQKDANWQKEQEQKRLFDREDEKQKLLFDREDKIKAKERAEAALDKGFSALSQAYLAQLTKMRDNVLPSQSDIDEYNRVYNDLQKFVKEHPEYGVQMSDLMLKGANGGKGVKTLESRFETLDGIVKDGKVDPADMQALKESLIEENVWAALGENKDWQAKWDLVTDKIEGDPLVRDALYLGSGKKKTSEDAQKALNKAVTQKKIDKELEKMVEAFKKKEVFDFTNLKNLGWYEEHKNDRKYMPYFRAFERFAKGRKK